MSDTKVPEEKLSEKQVIERIKDSNIAVWNEVSEFMALLEEWGISGYKLTGSIEKPIITSFEFNMG